MKQALEKSASHSNNLIVDQDSGNCQSLKIKTPKIQEWQMEALHMVDALHMSDRQILTVLAMLNGYTWRALVDYGVYDKEGEYHWDKLGRLVDSPSIMYAHTSLSDYISKHWPRAFSNRKTLFKWRYILMEYGLFHYDHYNRPRGARWGAENGVEGQGVATPPELEDINVMKMVVWYQSLYSVLESRMGKDALFDFMPKHGGMMMIQVYNALFNDLVDFRGNALADNPSIIIPVVTDGFKRQPVIWKWHPIFGLAKSVWRSLVRRAGAITQKMEWRRTPWINMAEIPY